MAFESIFANILDLPGVEGALLFGNPGQILHNAMPAFMPEEAFADAQRRIFAMYETMDENFLPCEDYTLNFEGHILILRKTDDCLLLVLGTNKLNQSSLRMVTNMAIKRIATHLAEMPTPRLNGTAHPPVVIEPAKTPPPAASEPEPAPAQQQSAPVAAATTQRKARYYRGQVYYDEE